MAISKAKKNEKVGLLSKELAGSTTAIIGTFTKLTVAKGLPGTEDLRPAFCSLSILETIDKPFRL